MKKYFLWIALCLSLLTTSAQAGVDSSVRSLWGPHGYSEQEVGATLTFPWVALGESLYQRPVSAWWTGASGSTFKQDNLSQSYRGELSGGMEFWGRSSLDLAIWMMPRPNNNVGAYRAEGLQATFSIWGPGWLPNVARAEETDRPIRSELALFVGYTQHEESLGVPGSENPFDDNPGRRGRGSGAPGVTTRVSAFSGGADDPGGSGGTGTAGTGLSNRDLRIHETRVGTTLTERFGKKTSARVSVEKHFYDQDLEALASQLDIFTLLNAENASSLDLLNGFTEYAWGLGADQQLFPWLKAGVDYRRANYVLGIASWAESYTGRITVYAGRFSVRPTYEYFKLRGRSGSSYYGFSVDLDI